MAVTPKLEIRQSQSLLMTPQLRQAISLLQMSNLELNSLIENELASNPLLEREDEHLSNDIPSEQTIDDYTTASAETTPALEGADDNHPDIDYTNPCDNDFGSDREGYDNSDYSWYDYAKQKNHSSDSDFDFFEQKLSSSPSLYQALQTQISEAFSSPKERLIASRLTEFLDESGYFRGDTRQLSSELKTPKETIDSVLNRMKEFEPSGIFAQSLQECIAIQLKDSNRLDCLMEQLLNHLDLLGQRKFKEIKKLLNIDDEDLSSLISDIKSTNPKPASAYQHDLTGYIIPDVFVRRTKHGEYKVELNNQSLPRLLINRSYEQELSQLGRQNKEADKYLKAQKTSAGFLIKSLRQRSDTIKKISEAIVAAQHDFFEQGIEHLRPLGLKDIAETVEMHESTVSRVTSNKYMHTPLGIFELKYFFSNAATSFSGDEGTSTTSIKHKIKSMIEQESPQDILSDDKISELLAREGLKVARRTVAKYRESLGIPTSSRRKQLKRD